MDLNKQSLRGMQRDAANRQAGIVDTSVLIRLDDIVIDDTIQVRLAGLDDERVNQYALAMIEYGGFGMFPPLVVFRDPETDVFRLAGGFHRRAAVDVARRGLIEDGKPPIDVVPCEVRTGGALEAVEFAEDDNLTHGLNLTNRDKRAIFERRLTDGHVWGEYSNRRIAAELGVVKTTIKRWRDELEHDPGGPNSPPEKRLGMDGKQYRVPKKIKPIEQPKFYDAPCEGLEPVHPVPFCGPPPPVIDTGLNKTGNNLQMEVDSDEDDSRYEELSDRLSDFIGKAINLSKTIEQAIQDGMIPTLPDGVADQINEALGYTHGYITPRGKAIPGVINMLFDAYENYFGEEWSDEQG